MPKTIRITIDGLILWVPRPHGAVTLLMPAAPGHVAKIVIPQKPKPDPSKPGDYVYEDIGPEVHVPALPSSGVGTAIPHVPKRVANIYPHTGVGVPKKLLSGTDPTLRARVNLWAGEWVGTSRPINFTLGGRVVALSNQVIWEIDHPADTLHLDLGADRITIPANDSTGEFIQFYICHVETGTLPGDGHVPTEPGQGTEVRHFHHLYDMMSTPANKHEVPKYHSGFMERVAATRAEQTGGKIKLLSELLVKLGLVKPRLFSDPVTCVGGINPP